MSDKLDSPDTPPYFHLITGHWADIDQQRNILLHFIHEKGLNEEFIKYLDKHFPEDEDGYR